MAKKEIKTDAAEQKTDIGSLKLSTQNVETVFMDCLFKNDEIVNGKPVVEPKIAGGIRSTFCFHPQRLQKNYNTIDSLIDQLKDIDKGPHFTELCWTKDGEQWTSFHKSMEQLVALGIASDILSYPLPRAIWPMGMPLVIRNSR